MTNRDSLIIKMISLLLIVVPLTVTCYFFIWANVSQRKQAEIEKNFTITTGRAQFIEHEIQRRIGLLYNLAVNRSVSNFRSKEHVERILTLVSTDSREGLFVADTEGMITASTKKVRFAENLRQSTAFANAAKGMVVTEQQNSVFTGEYTIAIYVPIYNELDKVVAIVANEIPIEFFKENLNQVRVGENGYLRLIDANGYFIYDKGVDNKKRLVPARNYIEAKGRERVIVERDSSRTGEKTVYTIVRINSLRWYVVAVQPASELVAPAFSLLTNDVLTLIFMGLALFILWRYKVSLEYRNMLISRQNAEKLALVGELAAGMAHEIRNPLTAIKGFSDLLKTRKEYKNDKEIFEIVSKSVDHIEGIVRETLLLAKPQVMEAKVFDLNSLVQETVVFMRSEALLAEIDIHFESLNTPVYVLGDQRHFKQVLVNVIKNALEASGRGGLVKINLEQTDKQMVQLLVEDSGEGIAPDVLDKIGTPFFTTKEKGTGLGLSVCKRIVEEHRGLFAIESKLGEGTRVKIVLPVYTKVLS